MMIALALLLASADKLPPANPLPPPASEEAAVLEPVNALFAAIAALDGAAMAAQGTGVGTISIASEEPDGSASTRHMSWADLAAGMKAGPENMRNGCSARPSRLTEISRWSGAITSS